MEYDIEQNAFHLPIKLGEKTIPKWSAVIGATALEKEVRQWIAPPLVELRRMLLDDVVKIVHAEVEEKLGDALQKRIPQIAQAVLDCDVDRIPESLATNSAYSRWVQDQRTAAEVMHGLNPPAEPLPGSCDMSRITFRLPVHTHKLVSALAAQRQQTDAACVLQLVAEGLTKTTTPLRDRERCASVAGVDTPESPAQDACGGTRASDHQTHYVRLVGETHRLLEEEFAAPGPAHSRHDIIREAAAIGLRVMRDRRNPPKVPRADIPAEYEYDPATDSYKRGRVLTIGVYSQKMHTAIEPNDTVLLRNLTSRRLRAEIVLFRVAGE